MKKRIVSLLLALCLLAGLLPAVTPQADAVISTVIGTSLKMCTSLVKIQLHQNQRNQNSCKANEY